MADYKLSKAAELKLAEIYEYSLLEFGETQVDAYFLSLHEAFATLAELPLMGRIYRRFSRHEHRAHSIFYTQTDQGVLIVQLFHHSENIALRAADL